MQLTVSDNKIAEALSEKVVFKVQPGMTFDGAKKGATASGEVDLYASPLEPGRVVARTAAGEKFPVTGTSAGWIRVGLDDGRFAFAKREDMELLPRAVAKAGTFEPVLEISPPRIALIGAVTQTDAKSLHFSGVATDGQALRDVFITVYNPSRNLFGQREKVFYQASPDPKSGRLEFAADVPLTPGNNIIEVHAREDEDVVAVRRMWVLRTSGLSEARAKQNTFAANGQLKVDRLK
jgi:carboxyl-terminal processing protease